MFGNNWPVNYSNIGFGFLVSRMTLNKMADIVKASSKNINVRNFATQLISQISPKDELGEVEAIYEYVKNNSHYVKDPAGTEMIQTPLVALDLWNRQEIFYGDCFSGDTEIIVFHKATKKYAILSFLELQNCWKKYQALSYSFSQQKFEFKDIIGLIHQKNKPTVQVKVTGKFPFVCTDTHEFFTYKGQKNKKIIKRRLKDIDLTNGYVRQIFTALQIPSLKKTENNDLLWLDGIYIAEGNSEINRIKIAQNTPSIVKRIENTLKKLNIQYSKYRTEEKGGGYFSIKGGKKEKIIQRLQKLGNISINKHFTNEHLSLTESCIKKLLSGYDDGDGCHPKKGAWKEKINTMYTTVSEELAKQLTVLHYIIGEPLTTFKCKPTPFSNYFRYRLYSFKNKIKSRKEKIPSLATCSIKKINKDKVQDVYCITVADNHTLTLANGIIASNCDDYTVLLLSLLKSIGYPVKLRATSYIPSKKLSHVYGMVRIYGEWFPIDGIKGNGYVGWEAPGVTSKLDWPIE